MNKILGFILLIVLFACNESEETQADYFSDCLYEAPTPIFSDRMSAVHQHRFKISASTGMEEVVFNSGLSLNIHQSGCESLQQNFYFEVEKDLVLSSAKQWIEQAGTYFYFLGTLDEAYLPLYEWGRLIKEHSNEITLNKAFEVYPGFFLTIKQYKKKNKTLLEVVLEQTS